MNDDESGTETYEESDDSSGSDSDMPGDSASKPERVHTSRVPTLALGGTYLTNASSHRQPSIPSLGLDLSGATAEEVPANQQPASSQTSIAQSLQADETPTRNDSDSAETTSLQLSGATDRHEKGQSLSRANSHRRPNRQTTPPLFTIQLASEAFVVDTETLDQPEYHHLSQSEAVKQFCSARLGLRFEALKFYELQEVQSMAECSESCTQLAVAVQDSQFSLQAYEDMLNQSKKDQAEVQNRTAALINMQALAQEQNQEVSKCTMRIGKLEREVKEKEEYCNRLQREITMQRDQLQRSDSNLLDGQKSMRGLKAQFDQLSTLVSERSSLVASTSPLGSGSFSPGLTGTRLSHELRSNSSLSASEATKQRLADVLERLCREEVLSTLERIVPIPGSKVDVKRNNFRAHARFS